MQGQKNTDATAYFRLPFVVMKLTGNAEKFNQGVMTNTLSAHRNSFIDIYGRTVAVFYQKFAGTELYIAFNEKYMDKLLGHIKMHLAIGKTKLEATGLNAYFVTATSHGNGQDVGIEIAEKNAFVLLSQNPPQGFEEMTPEQFKLFRLENGISMQGEEFEDEMIMNTDWGDAVSFSKGCFLGQEIVVKVTQRGKPPKRLVRILFEAEPEKITRGQFEVGEVRSKIFSEKLGGWVAYCSMPNDGLGVDGGNII